MYQALLVLFSGLSVFFLYEYLKLFFGALRAEKYIGMEWRTITELISRRNIAAVGLLSFEKDLPEFAREAARNIRKYGRAGAAALCLSEKARNEELFKQSLKDFLEVARKSPEVSSDTDFKDARRDLAELEYLLDAAELKYNYWVFRMKKAVSGKLRGFMAAFAGINARPYFSSGILVRPDVPVSFSRERLSSDKLIDSYTAAIGRDFQIKCACGMIMTIPPDLPGGRVFCQLCEAPHEVPDRYMRATEAILGKGPAEKYSGNPGVAVLTPESPSGKLKRVRSVFACGCGKLNEFLPGSGSASVCSSCGDRLRPENSATQDPKPIP